MTDKSYDRLIEELTNPYTYEEPLSGPFSGFLPSQEWWGWGYVSRNPAGKKKDRVSRDEEGKYHRIHGPSYTSFNYKIELWHFHGDYHREDGPAITHKETRVWYYKGKLHRIGGPAIDAPAHPKQYWIHGQQLSPKEYKKEIARRIRKGHYGYKLPIIENN